MAIINGTTGNDALNGTVGDDQIHDGNGGNDTLNGGDGNDELTITGGTDSADGGAGSDTIIVLWGDATGDVVNNGPFGNSGGGWYGNFTITGDRSVAYNRIEQFHVTTGSGNDVIATGDFNDIVSTGAGNDIANVNNGANVVDGGAGLDRLGISFAGSATGATINLLLGGAQQSSGPGSVTGFEGFTTVTGSGFADIFRSTDEDFDEIFSTGAGDDLVEVRNGVDSITMGAGSDTLVVDWSLSAGNVTNSGPFGNSGGGVYGNYYNSDGRQVDYSQVEHFIVTTGSGNDVIATWVGNDTVSMSAGDDIANVDNGANIVDGGTGLDRLGISFAGSATGATINLLLGGAQQSSGPGSVTGFEGFTSITGSDHADIFRSTGEDFDETFSTGAGDDLVEVRNGYDSVTMGSGNDTLVVDWSLSAGNVTNSGPFGNSGGGVYGSYINSDGRRVDYSQVENFIVTMGSGNDSIATWVGNDTVSMGAGDDIANVDSGINHVNGGAGNDRLGISYEGATTGAMVNLNLSGPQQSSGPGSVTGFEGFTTVTGSSLADAFYSTALDYDEVFFTGNGDDIVEVRNGNDSVTMGAGNDTLIVDWSAATGNVTNSGPFGNSGGGVYGTYAIAGDRQVDYSQVENFIVTTGSGNDVIATWVGNDSVSTGAGDDSIDAGRGTNIIDGGSGTDALSINYIDSLTAVTINLNLAGAQQTSGFGSVTGIERFSGLTGSAFDDVIVTGTANFDDIVDGGAGNDMFTMTDGDDSVEGQSGNDTLVLLWGASSGNVTTNGPYGNSGGGFYGNFNNVDGRSVAFNRIENFHITTGSGTDIVNTASGNDIITLGTGDDSSSTGDGADMVNGGAGNDTLNGGAGNDTLLYVDAVSGVNVNLATNSVSGGDGIDTISNFENVTGSDFNDMLTGTATANIINGGEGDDSMTGGAGDDQYSVDSAGDTVVELAAGGTDTVSASVSYSLAGEIENLVLTGVAAINGTGNASNNSITGNDAANILDGAGGDDAMAGGLGDDTYVVDSAGDSVAEAAGAGYDRVNTTLSSYTLGAELERLAFTGTGSFSGTGNALNNRITGGTGADSLFGLDGNDLLEGGGGSDTMHGGLGNDSYVVGQTGDVVVEGLNAGVDSVSSTVTYALSANVENLTLTGANAVNGTGNGIANTLTGNGAANTLNGGGGNDILSGGDGADILRGGTGTDSSTGGPGDDIIYLEAVGDMAFEGMNEGIDEVRAAFSYTLGDNIERLRLQGTAVSGTGNALDNLILGGAAANILAGLGGNDILYGYSNNDQIDGGDGNDTVFGGQGNDVLTGGLGADILRGEDNSDTAHGGAGADNLFGGLGNDTLNGDADADILRGEEQNDVLNGGTGNDQLFGDAGTDTLNGGDGVDRLTGGTGKDVMTGGAGKDTFAFAEGDFGGFTLPSADQITDFSQADDDLLNLSAVDAIVGAGNQAFTFVGTAAFSNTAGELRYAVSGGTTMVYGDTNGDSVADFAIRLDGALTLVAGDFIL